MTEIISKLVLFLVFLSTSVVSQAIPFSIDKDTVSACDGRCNSDSFTIVNQSTVESLKFDSLSFKMYSDFLPDLLDNWLVTFGYIGGSNFLEYHIHASSSLYISSYYGADSAALTLLPGGSLVFNYIYLARVICYFSNEESFLIVKFHKGGFVDSIVIVGTNNSWCYDNNEKINNGIKAQSIVINPNPFSPQTTISFSGALDRAPVKLNIIDPAGRIVRTMSGSANGGKVSYVWDGTDQNRKALARGVYVANVVGKGVNVKKLLVLTR